MTTLMKAIKYDLMEMGTEGTMVEIVKFVPKNTQVEVVSAMRTQTVRVNKDIYLVNSSVGSRMIVDERRDKNVKIVVNGYEGNDLYSAYELGLVQ
jgi:hypothetical protein